LVFLNSFQKSIRKELILQKVYKKRFLFMSVYEKLIKKEEKLALVGLGYVGMPIAVAFAKKEICRCRTWQNHFARQSPRNGTVEVSNTTEAPTVHE
jgi:hypothetical protein